MTYHVLKSIPAFNPCRLPVAKVAAVSVLALSMIACRGHMREEYGLGMLNFDHHEMHPILVSQEPVSLSIPVRRGSYGLTRAQQMRVAGFLSKYRARDIGNAKLLIKVPSGSANEVAAMEAVADLRQVISQHGFDATIVRVTPYTAPRHTQPPIRISYARYVAKAPECGNFPTNLATQYDNMHYANFGCADQHNLAVMVANPADLADPRTMTPRSEERRRVVWQKYTGGQSTGAQRSRDEKIDTTK